MADKYEDFEKKLDKIILALYGNGDYEKGICSRIQKNTDGIKHLQNIVKAHWGLGVLLLVTLIGIMIKL